MLKGNDMKKRPAYVEKLIKEANDYFRRNKVQDYNNDSLFCFIVHCYLPSKWYRGFNFHIDRYVDINGTPKLVRALTGPIEGLPVEEQSQWYVQIW